MEPVPKTAESWTARGYLFDRRGECEACGAKVEFWWSPGRLRKLVPLDAVTLEAHWSSCPNAREFQSLQAGAA